MELLHPAMWHDHDIDFARWLHPAICDSGIIMTVNSQSGSTCNVIRGSGMTCHWIRPNVRHIGILRFRFWPYHRSRHVILHQSAKFYPNRTTLSREKLDAGMWWYHANRTYARWSQLEEWTRTFSRTRSLSNATFHFFDHVMKINQMIFHWDISNQQSRETVVGTSASI